MRLVELVFDRKFLINTQKAVLATVDRTIHLKHSRYGWLYGRVLGE